MPGLEQTRTIGNQRVLIGGTRYHRCFYCDRWYRARSDERLALHCPEHAQVMADAFAAGFRAAQPQRRAHAAT